MVNLQKRLACELAVLKAQGVHASELARCETVFRMLVERCDRYEAEVLLDRLGFDHELATGGEQLEARVNRHVADWCELAEIAAWERTGIWEADPSDVPAPTSSSNSPSALRQHSAELRSFQGTWLIRRCAELDEDVCQAARDLKAVEWKLRAEGKSTEEIDRALREFVQQTRSGFTILGWKEVLKSVAALVGLTSLAKLVVGAAKRLW